MRRREPEAYKVKGLRNDSDEKGYFRVFAHIHGSRAVILGDSNLTACYLLRFKRFLVPSFA